MTFQQHIRAMAPWLLIGAAGLAVADYGVAHGSSTLNLAGGLAFLAAWVAVVRHGWQWTRRSLGSPED